RPLLSDAGLDRRRRRRVAGDLADGLAGYGRLPWTLSGAHLALPHSHHSLPQHDSRWPTSTAPRAGTALRATDTVLPVRGPVAPALPGRTGREGRHLGRGDRPRGDRARVRHGATNTAAPADSRARPLRRAGVR